MLERVHERRSSLRAVCLLVALGGCGHAQVPPTTPARVGTSPEAFTTRDSPATSQAAGRTCQLEPVYFSYDSALIDGRTREGILAAASCYNHGTLTQSLRLQGATDPRGTEEYNLALGMRRAEAVRHLLVTVGVALSRISVTSTGEESAVGRDETGWARDRHVVAIDQ